MGSQRIVRKSQKISAWSDKVFWRYYEQISWGGGGHIMPPGLIWLKYKQTSWAPSIDIICFAWQAQIGHASHKLQRIFSQAYAPVTFPPGAGRRAPGGEGVSGGHPMSRPSETNPGCLKLHLVTVTLDTGATRQQIRFPSIKSNGQRKLGGP